MTNNIEKISKIVKNYANKPRHQVRKEEYQVTEIAWIKELLTRGAFGNLATSFDNQPFITPLLFIYLEDHHALYIHGPKAGRTFANIHLNPQVCFNVSEFGQIIPQDTALEFNVEYNSITVFGTAELVADPAEAAQRLQDIMDKYAPHLKPGRDYEPIPPTDVQRTAVIKIAIEDWSAKRQQIEPEDTGTFFYPHPPVIKL